MSDNFEEAAGRQLYNPWRQVRPRPPKFARQSLATVDEFVSFVGRQIFGADWSGSEFSARNTPTGGWSLAWPSHQEPTNYAARHPRTRNDGNLVIESASGDFALSPGEAWTPSLTGKAIRLPIAEAEARWRAIISEVETSRAAEEAEWRRWWAAAQEACGLLGEQLVTASLLAPNGQRRDVMPGFWDTDSGWRVLLGWQSDEGTFDVLSPRGTFGIAFPGRIGIERAEITCLHRTEAGTWDRQSAPGFDDVHTPQRQSGGSTPIKKEASRTSSAGGAPIKYNWDEMVCELVRWANDDGLPVAPDGGIDRTAVLKGMLKFAETWLEAPDESTIRKRLRQWLGPPEDTPHRSKP